VLFLIQWIIYLSLGYRTISYERVIGHRHDVRHIKQQPERLSKLVTRSTMRHSGDFAPFWTNCMLLS